jgi:hypothetical protein
MKDVAVAKRKTGPKTGVLLDVDDHFGVLAFQPVAPDRQHRPVGVYANLRGAGR